MAQHLDHGIVGMAATGTYYGATFRGTVREFSSDWHGNATAFVNFDSPVMVNQTYRDSAAVTVRAVSEQGANWSDVDRDCSIRLV